MKKVRVVAEVYRRAKKIEESSESELLVFCDKETGATQFRAESPANEAGSVERAAGLLAIQCLVRGHDPENFVVLVPAEQTLSSRLVTRARELLKEGRAISCPVPLSPRQKEILHSVVRSLSNKEIASSLNISVRTVKFHISTLLEKFGVDSRGALARKAAPMLGMHEPAALSEFGEPQPAYPNYRPQLQTMEPPLNPRTAAAAALRFPSKFLPA